jgi:hypothetical protein
MNFIPVEWNKKFKKCPWLWKNTTEVATYLYHNIILQCFNQDTQIQTMQQHQIKIKCQVTRHSLYCCKSQKYLAVVGFSLEQHAEQGVMLTFLPIKINVSIKIFRSQSHSLAYDELTETSLQNGNQMEIWYMSTKISGSIVRR